MTNEQDNIIDSGGSDDAADTGANAGAGGLNAALSGGDSEFVVGEQKKPLSRSTLAVFGLVVAAAGGLYFMHARSGPSAAVAASAETAAANETINQFLTSGDQNIAKMQAMIRDTEKIVQQFLQYPSMKQVPLSELKTNPFRYASATPTNGKADPSEAESKRRKEQERLAVIKAVQGLQLQSIMHSDKARACMISNTLYQEGQQIESMTIETINPHSVIVSSGGYRFELKMQR